MRNIIISLLLFLVPFIGYSAPAYFGLEFNDAQKAYLDSENILVNPGFELGLTGWTTTGTATSEPTVVFKGKKSLKVVLSNQVLNITQNSTLYAAQFADGAQGLLTVRIKNTAPGVRFCPTQAGVIISALCVNVSTNGKWGHYKRPVTLGGTSNGFTIDSNGVAVSGTTIVDDSKLSAQDVKQEVTTCTDVKCEAGFSAKVSASGVVSSENLDWISGNASIASTSFYTITFNTGVFSVTPNCLVTPSNSSSFESRLSAESATSLTSQFFINNGVPTATAFNISCQKTGTDFINAKALANGSVYTSTNADTSIASWTPVITTATGTMVNYSASGRWHRDGQHLIGEVSIVFSSASGTWVTPIIVLPNGLLVDTSKMVDPAEARLGQGTALDNLVNRYGLRVSIFGTSVAINSGFVTSSATAGTPISDNSTITSTFPFAFNTGDRLTVNFKVPVVGWENSNTIIGSFTGMVTSQGSASPDIQSVYFGGGPDCSSACTGTCTICNQVGSKITSVTWSATGTYLLNGIDGKKYNCSGTGYTTSNIPILHQKPASSTTNAFMQNNPNSNSAYNSVICLGNP